MKNIKRRAWKEYFKGNYLRAGDLYNSAGDLEKASKMYIKAKDFRAAADAEEHLGRIENALNFLLKVSDHSGAAEMLIRHGRFSKAAELYAREGNLIKAAEIALKAGNPLMASECFEKAGMYMEAGRLAFRGDNIGKALLCFEKVLKNRPVQKESSLTEQLETKEEIKEIAHYFELGEAYERAGELYEELNMTMQAAECWKAAKRYTKAAELYRLAGADGHLSALVDLVEEAPPELQADSLIAKGKYEEAARLLVRSDKKERAASLFEKSGNLAAAAELRRELGDYEMAGNLFFKTESYMAAADCFRHGGLYAMAEDSFVKAGDEKSASLMAFESGSWERAMEMAPDAEQKELLLGKLQALSGRPGQSNRIQLLKARTFIDLDQPKVAKSCLEGFQAETEEDKLKGLYLQGRIAEKLEDFRAASKAYRKILAEDVSFLDVGSRLKSLESLANEARKERERYSFSKVICRDPIGEWVQARDSLSGRSVLVYRVMEETALAISMPDPPGLLSVRALNNPNNLRLIDAYRDKKGFNLVYENFQGRPLILWQAEGYRASMYSTMDKLSRVLDAFMEAHESNIYHGFFSPGSVWMDSEGEIKVSGFGLLKRTKAIKSMEGMSSLLAYSLSEKSENGSAFVKRDLFSIGCVFFELLSGNPPGANGNNMSPSEEAEKLRLPSNVKKILARLLSTVPGSGYLTVRELITDLSAQEFPPGAIIAGRYEILEELGRGGMGQVFRVKDRELEEIVALKTLRKQSGMTTESRARFMREIKVSRKITHPNVVRVFDFGAWRDLVFLTMEYVSGVTLLDWVKRGLAEKATLRQKLEILRGVASGLQEAHKLGIVHRDLKPQNVILSSSGIPKLLDFGIAFVKVEESADLTQDGHFVGSPKYVSPEQIKGQELGPQSDIYSFGLLAYFLLTGKHGFDGKKAALVLMKQLNEMPLPPSEFVRIPPRLEELVMKCLIKEPEKRPQSLAEVTVALKELV